MLNFFRKLKICDYPVYLMYTILVLIKGQWEPSSLQAALLAPLISTQDFLQGSAGRPRAVNLLPFNAKQCSPHCQSFFTHLPLLYHPEPICSLPHESQKCEQFIYSQLILLPFAYQQQQMTIWRQFQSNDQSARFGNLSNATNFRNSGLQS